jgi:hypothetical protein
MPEEKNNSKNKSKNKDFVNAVDANLKAYTSHRNSLGVRLIGLLAGLFTLLQTVQN